MVKKEDLLNTFGLCEFEDLAFNIIKFTEGDFTKSFFISDVTDDPAIFAMFAASGWLYTEWFPQKRKFVVSKGFIERLKEKNKA